MCHIRCILYAERTQAQVLASVRGSRSRPGFPEHFPAEDPELAKRKNPLRVHWKGSQTTREAQNVQRGQKMVYNEGRYKTANRSTQSIQERKIICHHVEKEPKKKKKPHFSSPQTICLALKSFIFKRDNEIIPMNSTLSNNVYFIHVLGT